MPAFRDETALLVLIAVGAIVYGGSILLLFGKGWLRSLVRELNAFALSRDPLQYAANHDCNWRDDGCSR